MSSFSLKPYHTLALESVAEGVEEITGVAQLQAYRKTAGHRPLLVLGEGSNIVPAPNIRGYVAVMRNRGIDVRRGAEFAQVTAAAGENWHEFVLWTLSQDLFGLENLALIPGSVGAAPVQNIGAYGAELADFLSSVSVVDLENGEMVRLAKEQCGFGYRDSVFKRQPGRFAIVEITLRLSLEPQLRLSYPDLQAELAAAQMTQPSALDVARAVMRIRGRKLPDPSRHPNVGSFFKNPVISREQFIELTAEWPELKGYAVADGIKLAAAQLLDIAGWKGRSGEGVRVWPQQPLVLVNEGARSGEQVLKFAAVMQRDIEARFAVRLEIEPDRPGFNSMPEPGG